MTAVAALAGPILIRVLLDAHGQDAEVINLSGRQRMLSQRMATFALVDPPTEESRAVIREALAAWRVQHHRLIDGDLRAFAAASPATAVADLTERLAAFERLIEHRLDERGLLTVDARETLLDAQSRYLDSMDAMVFRFSHRSASGVDRIQALGLGFAALLLGLLLFEWRAIFRPLASRLQRRLDERERLLRRAQRDARYVRAIQSADLGAWQWNIEADELTWSREFGQIVGLPAHCPQTWTTLMDRMVDPDRFNDALRGIGRGAGELRFEGQLQLEGGSYRWIRLRGRLDGAFAYGVVADIDVARRHQAERERLLEAHDHQLSLARKGLADVDVMSAVHSLASGLAHDMNNLMQVIQASVELIRDGDSDPELLDDIVHAVDEAGGLTEQMLDLRPSTPASHQQVPVEALIGESRPVLQRAVSAPVALEWDVADVFGLQIVGNPSQIRRALLNLVLNAREAIRSTGCITIGAAVRHGGIEFTVEDDGMGIPPEIRGRVLEPFFSTRSSGRGRGLGLAVAHACVLAHGGTLTLESSVGHGTLARMWLPLAAEAPATVDRASNTDAATDRSLGLAASPASPEAGAGDPWNTEHLTDACVGPLVLLVEDEERIRAGLQRALVSFGYRVAAAADGAEALRWQMASVEAPTAIVCDVVMPGLLGPEVVRLLRERAGYTIPAVMVSGNHAADLGVDAPSRFLRKPYSIDDLRRALVELVGEAAPCLADAA